MTKGSKGKKFAKKSERRSRQILWALLLLLGLPALALCLFIWLFNINAYRVEMAEALTARTGRAIELNGPISWGFSLQRGLNVTVADVALGNPDWTSRPLMAKIGKARLEVDLKALLNRQIDIVAFDLVKADILLETRADGTGNWTFSSQDGESKKAAEKTKTAEPPTVVVPAPSSAVRLNVREVRILDSRLGFRGKDGKLTIVDVPKLTLSEQGAGLHAWFKGSVGEEAVSVELTGGKIGSIGAQDWPFLIRATYGVFSLDGKGHLGAQLKAVVFDDVDVSSGPTKVAGNLSVALDGPRPFVRGKLHGPRFNPADLARAPETKAEGTLGDVVKVATGQKPKRSDGRLFPKDPLPFDALKGLDADVSLTIKDLILNVLALENVKVQANLNDARLVLSPLSAHVAGSKVEGQVKVDASLDTPRVEVRLKGDGLEFSKLDLGGAEDLVSGKVDVDLDLASEGESVRALAAHADGHVKLQMDSGKMSTSGLKSIATGLVNIFLPGASLVASPGINCLAARYKLTNGLAETEGLLIDMDTTTVAGEGVVNLADEHVNMRLKTRPKGVGVGAIVPPMKIYGPLASPTFTLDANGAVEKVTGLLTGESSSDGVPALLHLKDKNACAVTLDNPKLAASAEKKTESAQPVEPTSVDRLTDTVKGLGGKLLHGLGQELFGQ